MGGSNDDVLSAGVEQHLNRLSDSATGVDHVVNQHAGAALNVTNHAVSHRLVGASHVTGLVNECQRGATKLVRPTLGHANTASVRRNHRGVSRVNVLRNVVNQHRLGPQVVPGAVKEALLLGRVQVHAHEALSASSGIQICNQAGRDRLAPQVFLVLAGVGEEGSHHRDALGRGTLKRIHHN